MKELVLQFPNIFSLSTEQGKLHSFTLQLRDSISQYVLNGIYQVSYPELRTRYLYPWQVLHCSRPVQLCGMFVYLFQALLVTGEKRDTDFRKSYTFCLLKRFTSTTRTWRQTRAKPAPAPSPFGPTSLDMNYRLWI